MSDSGFTVQLNADNGPIAGADAWQQYAFFITGNSIQGMINNWGYGAVNVCGGIDVASTPISNGIPKGYTLRITPQFNEEQSVTGALFEVLNGSQTVGSAQLLVSETGCFCSLPPGVQCTGSTALSPMTMFQVNIVGPGGGAGTTFSSGAGIINYAISEGTLTALNVAPASCLERGDLLCTAERSNCQGSLVLT